MTDSIEVNSPATVEKLAAAIFQAYKSKQAIDATPYTVVDEATAYQVQDRVLALKQAEGEKLKGYKIGLASTVLQEAYQTDHATYGGMTDRNVLSTLSLPDFIGPALEFEVIFLVDETINATDDLETIMNKCRVAPGFELPDGRFHHWFGGISLNTFIADASVTGAVCIGEPVKASYDDIDNIFGKVTFNGQDYKEGYTEKVLGHPANPVKWLAEALEAKGDKLEAGQFVASGSINTPSPIEPGEYVGTFENIGSVKLTVTE